AKCLWGINTGRKIKNVNIFQGLIRLTDFSDSIHVTKTLRKQMSFIISTMCSILMCFDNVRYRPLKLLVCFSESTEILQSFLCCTVSRNNFDRDELLGSFSGYFSCDVCKLLKLIIPSAKD